MREIICIVCPKGCHLKVDESNGFAVTGHDCARGEAYGVREVQNPMRTVTSTVKLKSASHKRLPVKTNGLIPKAMMLDSVKLLDGLVVTAPIENGQVILTNILDTGVDFVATRTIR